MRAKLQNDLRDLDDTKPMTAEQLKKMVDQVQKLWNSEGVWSNALVRGLLKIRANDPERMVAVRSRLVDYGIPEERLRQFPALQLILLDEKRAFETRRDEFMKLMTLPLWQIEELAKQIDKSNGDTLIPSRASHSITHGTAPLPTSATMRFRPARRRSAIIMR